MISRNITVILVYCLRDDKTFSFLFTIYTTTSIAMSQTLYTLLRLSIGDLTDNSVDIMFYSKHILSMTNLHCINGSKVQIVK